MRTQQFRDFVSQRDILNSNWYENLVFLNFPPRVSDHSVTVFQNENCKKRGYVVKDTWFFHQDVMS